MAELPNGAWMMTLVVLFAGVFSDDAPLNTSLNNATYNCNMDINNAFWEMECTSRQTDVGFLNGNFFYLQLQGIFKANSTISFHDLLNSTSLSDSELFICEAIWRDIIRLNPSSLVEFCENHSKSVAQSIHHLNQSFLTSISITRVTYIEALMNILNESLRLDEIKIYNSYLPNLTNFPVHPNNSITILVLEQNKIENINGESISKLPNLTLLDLSKNDLTHINRSLFDELTMISTLDLSYNLIEEIANDAFTNMFSLKNLYLQNNNLKNISESIFPVNNSIQILDFSINDLKILPPTIFYKFSDLKNISCSNCNLLELDEFIFANSIKIEYIMLQHNNIKFIPDSLFQNLKYLYYLNLGFNLIKTPNRNIFSFNSNLRFLFLNENDISSLKNWIYNVSPRLYYLDMSGNKVNTLTDEHVKLFYDLEHFDLRHNKIQAVELGLMQDVKIRKLLLSDNLISMLKVKWEKLVFLEGFYMDNNSLTSLDVPPCIQSIKQTITFSFKYNKITSVNLDSLIQDEIKVRTDRKKMAGCFFNGAAKNFVDLTHNPLICDCSLFPLYKYIKGTSERYQLETFLDEGNLTCLDPKLKSKNTIIYLKDDAFYCPFTIDCPMLCTCGIRGNDNATFVNCSGSHMLDVPQNVPEETTVLYFNGNRLRSMHSLNSKYWIRLKELHLDNNSLTNLNDWNYPASLRYLSLRGNNLTTIPTSLMHFISNQTYFRLYFGNNDENCACDREELKNFINENIELIGDVENIVCEVINNGTVAYLPLSSVPDSELCPVVGLNYNQRRIIISLCIFFTILIIVMLTYYKQRQIILSFLYIHCDQLFRLCYTEDEYDEEKIFDAFVAYSSSDRHIVMDIIQELENHPPYFQLCIHERNWVPGRFICDNILSSVQSSKRTIVVLSNSFITSPWFNLELRAAVSKMSKDRISRIIVILVDKSVPLSNVDPELRHVISTRTYLVWKERWFWEKLRYAMPRIKRMKENGTAMCRTKRSHSTLSLMPDQT